MVAPPKGRKRRSGVIDGEISQAKNERLKRLLPMGRGVWVPIDHAVSDWPVEGLDDIAGLVNQVTARGGADALVAHRGPLTTHRGDCSEKWRGGWVCHLSVSTRHGGDGSGWKRLAGEARTAVESALSRGAVAVSVQVNLGDPAESEMLVDMAKVADACHALGVPLLGMVYPRGPSLSVMQGDDTGAVAHAVRIAWELGCDVVKVPWTGDSNSFHKVTAAAPIPVLIAGGANSDEFGSVIRMVRKAMAAGAAGVCMGRQVFASDNPSQRVRQLAEVVHGLPWDADGRFKFDPDEADALDDLYELFEQRLGDSAD